MILTQSIVDGFGYPVKQGLPTNVREYLLANNLGAASLLCDVLYYLDIEPGRRFTEREALELVYPMGIGRKIVRAALASSAIFPMVKRRKDGTPGRPPWQYELQTTTYIAERCGLWPSASDGLSAPDLCSLPDYRAAIHRLLIERRPGQYTRKFLAERLGVTARTTRNYDGDDIEITPQFSRQSLTPNMLRQWGDRLPSRWFEFNGRRYPGLRIVGIVLLSRKEEQGGDVIVVEQQANIYSIKEIEP